MSHFSVIVATKDFPSQEVLNNELQRYHEFECDGIDDVWVQSIDMMDEVTEEYAKQSDHEAYPTLAEYCEGYYGFNRVDNDETPDRTDRHKYGWYAVDANGKVVQIIKRTNPNKKHDYWTLGGRYAGKFLDKNGTSIDYILKKNIDVAQMKAKCEQERRGWCNDCIQRAKITWDELNTACQQDHVAHAKWMELEEPKPRGSEYRAWLKLNDFEALAKAKANNFDLPKPDSGQSLDEWCDAAPYLTGFAFVREGKWYEKGEMGWWACISNEKSDWHEQFVKLIDDVPEDWYLTCVDCHI